MLALSIYNLQLKYKLSSLTYVGQLQKFEEISVGGTVFPSHPIAKKVCTGTEFLFVDILARQI